MADESKKDVEDTGQEVGTDPQQGPQQGKKKDVVAPDPEKVKEAERKKRGEKGERET